MIDLVLEAIMQGNVPEASAKEVPEINWEFIKKLEGYRDKGYVPENNKGEVIGDSGVTIGHGVDLGGQDEEYLRRLGLQDDELLETIAPYLGKKRLEAKEAIEATPLRLPPEKIAILDEIFNKRDLNVLKSSVGEEGYKNMPIEARTVLMSLIRNYGPTKPPTWNTYKAITSGDYPEAIRRLDTKTKEEWNDEILWPRRGKEADLLEKLIGNKYNNN